VHFQVAGLLRGPDPSGWPVTPRDVQVAIADLEREEDVDPRSVTTQSTWKKSTATIVAAWVRRNWRQLVSVCRDGAGGIRRRRRIRRMVEALTRWPSLSSSPWVRR
jgi:hypothetical protein